MPRRLYSPDDVCSVPGCHRDVHCKSLCESHYTQARRDRETRPCSFPGCSGKVRARGLCGGHYKALREGRPLRPLVVHSESLEERFWAKVNKIGPTPDPFVYGDLGPCWLWTAATDKGYGQMTRRIGGRQRNFAAHRIAWELEHGPIGDGLWVLHRCDNPGCVRASHMFLGDQHDNMQDMISKGRGGHRTHPESRPRGEQNPQSKLTETIVRLARQRVAAGETMAALAREYGVSPTTMQHAVKGRNWKHLQ